MSSRHRPRSIPHQPRLAPSSKRGARLRWRIVAVLLLVSLVPLALLGGGAWIVFGQLLEDRSLEVHRAIVRSHSAAIDAYLLERQRALALLAKTHRLDDLRDPATLAAAFAGLEGQYGGSFVDLGVIRHSGAHAAYVGPHDLADKNYAESEWFGHVMGHGAYVSDVFMGFRGHAHCVVAVRVDEGAEPWILRATINSSQFEALVRTDPLGATGEVFLVNRAGIYQTPPPGGEVLGVASGLSLEPHAGLRTSRVMGAGRETVQATAWVNQGRWMLVVRQAAAEIRAPLHRALGWGALLMAVAVCLVVATTVLATWHLTREIDRAIEQRNELSRELVRSARLASLGELATGLAHEINNPLAIMSSERTNITDVVGDLQLSPEPREELAGSLERIRRQIERCSGITSKMLHFGRKMESHPEPVPLEPRLKEVQRLLAKQAAVRNVDIAVEVEAGLPAVMVDPTELEQVLVNLVTNSLQAIEGEGEIRLRAGLASGAVVLEVEDDGPGIEREHLDRIFQPFFTTKPVGQGTGLGLAVCYGLVRGWGGTIEAESEPGQGTTMSLRLPTVPGPSPRRADPPNEVDS